MSTQRSPNAAGSFVLAFGATLAVLMGAWLMANIIVGVLDLYDTIKELLWP